MMKNLQITDFRGRTKIVQISNELHRIIGNRPVSTSQFDPKTDYLLSCSRSYGRPTIAPHIGRCCGVSTVQGWPLAGQRSFAKYSVKKMIKDMGFWKKKGNAHRLLVAINEFQKALFGDVLIEAGFTEMDEGWMNSNSGNQCHIFTMDIDEDTVYKLGVDH